MTQRLKASTAELFICFQTVPGIDDNTIINGGDGNVTGLKDSVKPQGKGLYGFKMPKGKACEFELFDTKYTINCIPVWKCGARDCPGHERNYHRCSPGVWFCRRVKPPCPGHSSKDHSCKDEGGQVWKCGEQNCPGHSKKKDTCKKPGTWFCGRFDPPCPGHSDINDTCPDPHALPLQFHIWKCGARDCPGHEHPSDRCSSGVWFCRRVEPPCPGHSSKDHSCKDEEGQVWKCGEENCPGHSKKEHTCKKPGRWFCGRSNPPCPGHDDVKGACSNIYATNAYNFTNWGGLAENDKTECVQRTLEVLGYYTGNVDHKRGEKTERAILNFQADNTLRTDGVVGAKTLQKLKEITDKNKLGKIRILRKNLIRFTRAPSSTDPTVTSGRPWAKAPDPDDRGFVKVKTNSVDLEGPVVTIPKDTQFRVKLIREKISINAKLFAKSSNESIIKPVSTNELPKKKEIIIEYKAIAKGNARIEIVFKNASGEIKIGFLQVIVLDLITVHVRPYWVTINGTAPSLSKVEYEKLFKIATNILWHIGINLIFHAWWDKIVNGLTAAGTISDDVAGNLIGTEFDTIMNAKDTANRNAEDTKINLLIVKGIDGAEGITFSAARAPWPNGVALRESSSGKLMTAINLAHEIGHFLALAQNLKAPKRSHAEDDPDKDHKKKDIWSIRRLMYGLWPSNTRSSDAWARNVGYGKDLSGCMISIRNLPKDPADNECYTARKWSKNGNFYRKP